MLDAVVAALAALKAKADGTFAAERGCDAGALAIGVVGVGTVRLPVSAATARKLCAVATPASFGKRDKTLRDPAVRNTWEIPASLVKIVESRWMSALAPQLAQLGSRLGMPKDAELTATLDKLLVYEQGQFFAPHQDSERSDDMVASLVVKLPSACTGGALVVRHGGEEKVFHKAARGPKAISLVAFYADCQHEVRPVTSGHRVVLTYHVRRRGKPRAPAVVPAVRVEGLADAVQSYFSTPVARRYDTTAPQRPDRLIYLLDHEYTEKSLGWDRIKGADRPRVEALLEVAGRLGCETFLALADVHENWSCDEGEAAGWYDRRRRDASDEDEDEEEGEDEGDHELTELIDADIELRHWVGRDGRSAPSVPVTPSMDEVCSTKASDEMAPFRSEHEGYQGNYGNTVDRWYHRAALVMWPRGRDFVIRAKVSPTWALSQVAARLKSRDLPAARAMAGDLLPFWDHVAPQEQGKDFFVKLVQTAASLGDPDLAHALLAPFGPDRLSAPAAAAVAGLVESHGLKWAERLFSTWSERVRFGGAAWLTLLPGVCQALLAGAARHGAALAAWLVSREAAAFGARGTRDLRASAGFPSGTIEGHRDELIALLEAAALVGAPSMQAQLVAPLMHPDTALPLVETGALLQRCRARRAPDAVRALGLEALVRHVEDGLQRTLAAPERRPDDWSIEPTGTCPCELCRVLAAFLRDPARIEYAWPLAEPKRRHVHGVIDLSGLPVAHVTTRRGSPFALVLTKRTSLFAQAAKLREQQRDLLAWIARERTAFAASAGK